MTAHDFDAALGPAAALFPETRERFRHEHPAEHIRFIADIPEFRFQAPGHFDIVGNGLRIPKAGVDDGTAPPGSDDAGDGHDLAHQALGPFDETDDAGVFRRLDLRQEGRPVADAGIARHGADAGKGIEMPDRLFDGVFIEHRIGIEGDDDFAVADGQGQVEAVGFAHILLQMEDAQVLGQLFRVDPGGERRLNRLHISISPGQSGRPWK